MSSPQGPTKNRYQFIPRVLIFLTRGDEVLLLKRAADRPIFPGLYNGLGGHVERGESVLAAARREVEEESGLLPTQLWLCATIAIDPASGSSAAGNDPAAGILMHVFRGEAHEADGEPRPSNEGALEWVPLGQIPALPMVEDIPTLLPKILELDPGSPPLWGLYTYDTDGKLTIRFEE